MKSIIEEGSSISKAVEAGWLKAGKPKEFTVKVFQEAKTNFFGFTKIPAKVAIFFQEELREKSQYRPRPNNQRNDGQRVDNRPNPKPFNSNNSARPNNNTNNNPNKPSNSNIPHNPNKNPNRPPQKFVKKPDLANVTDKNDNIKPK